VEWGAKGVVTVRTGRLRKELIARHFVRQIKEVGRGYSPSRVGEDAVTPVPATLGTKDDQ
jgi:hypothetical protein